MQICKMIKNKVLLIKNIFKTYSKILKTFQILKQNFVLQNIIKQFLRIILKNYFL